MKRVIGLILLVGLMAGFLYAVSVEPKPSYNPAPVIPATRQGEYKVIRTVTANDTALEPNDKYWDSISTTWFSVPDAWNRVELSFLGYGDGTGDGDCNSASFKVTLYGARYKSSAKTIFQGEVGIGDVEASCDPESGEQYNSGSLDPNESYKFADLIDANGLGDLWPSGVSLSDGTDATGSNIATMNIDVTGYFKLWPIITEKSGFTNVKVLITGY